MTSLPLPPTSRGGFARVTALPRSASTSGRAKTLAESRRLGDILKLWLHEPMGIQTTSITVHEEGKTDRGALKVVSREKLEDGRFRIIYRGDFRDDSFADVVADWLQRHGQRIRV